MGGFPDLYLMRHGQTEWNRLGRLQGLLDSPLTDLGRQQGRRLARLLRQLPDTCQRISSPAGRAVATARLAFQGADFAQDSRLQEIDIGSFSGHSLEALRQRQPELFYGTEFDWYDRTPDGEGFDGLMRRCRDFLGDLDQPALIMTHGITLRMLRLIAMELPLTRLAEMPVLQGAVHHVSRKGHRIIF